MLEKRQPLQLMVLGKVDIHMQTNENRSLFLTLPKNISSKWIQDLNVRPETLKPLEEYLGKSILEVGIGNDFLSRTQIAQEIIAGIDELDYIQLRTSAQQRKQLAERRGSLQNGRKKTACHSLDRRLTSIIYKEVKKLIHK